MKQKLYRKMLLLPIALTQFTYSACCFPCGGEKKIVLESRLKENMQIYESLKEKISSINEEKAMAFHYSFKEYINTQKNLDFNEYHAERKSESLEILASIYAIYLIDASEKNATTPSTTAESEQEAQPLDDHREAFAAFLNLFYENKQKKIFDIKVLDNIKDKGINYDPLFPALISESPKSNIQEVVIDEKGGVSVAPAK